MNMTETDSPSLTSPPQWLRVPQAVQLYGIGKSTLWDLIRRGKIRSSLVSSSRATKKTGTKHGSRLVNAASLEAFISATASGGDQETPRRAKKGGKR